MSGWVDYFGVSADRINSVDFHLHFVAYLNVRNKNPEASNSSKTLAVGHNFINFDFVLAANLDWAVNSMAFVFCISWGSFFGANCSSLSNPLESAILIVERCLKPCAEKVAYQFTWSLGFADIEKVLT